MPVLPTGVHPLGYCKRTRCSGSLHVPAPPVAATGLPDGAPEPVAAGLPLAPSADVCGFATVPPVVGFEDATFAVIVVPGGPPVPVVVGLPVEADAPPPAAVCPY